MSTDLPASAFRPNTHRGCDQPMPPISVVMPTITWTGTFPRCAGMILELMDRRPGAADEVLVVFDGVAPPIPSWLKQADVRVLCTTTRSGPGAARNLGAREAAGEILLFVDADVELHADSLERVRARFGERPDLDALFGSYDDRPAAAGTVSRFRNLLHHHTHTSNPGRACTFWAGCGAIRRARFLALGGFDVRYRLPSIEDIELGMRLAASGGRILLDPAIRCTHHKRWTLGSMLRTDILQRAIPWSRLLLHRRELPQTLNLSLASRLSGLLTLGLALSLPLLPLLPALGWFSGTCLVALLLLNSTFYGLCLRQGGALFLLCSIALHLLYLLYSSLTFALVAVHGRLSALQATFSP